MARLFIILYQDWNSMDSITRCEAWAVEGAGTLDSPAHGKTVHDLVSIPGLECIITRYNAWVVAGWHY
eukprot:1144328-Pelagomonas_calceolata.AAC.8